MRQTDRNRQREIDTDREKQRDREAKTDTHIEAEPVADKTELQTKRIKGRPIQKEAEGDG